MKSCWSFNVGCRPSFGQLRETFTRMLEEESGLEYFDFKVHEDRLYYRIDSDEMDQDYFGDEMVDCSDGLRIMSTVPEMAEDPPGFLQTHIVHEIPQENCTIEEICKANGSVHKSSDGIASNNEYSDKAFKRNESTTSSFHNGLYEDLDDDRILGLPNAMLYPSVCEGEDTSTGSDEVFEDCQACSHIHATGNSDIEIRRCKRCCKRDINLKHIEIHTAERIDSGIGSDSSSTRCHIRSSNSSVNNNDDIMSDSSKATPPDYSGRNSTGNYGFDDDPRNLYDRNFLNLRTDHLNHANVTNDMYNVGKADCKSESIPSDIGKSQLSPSIVVRSENPNAEKDVWSIDETKF